MGIGAAIAGGAALGAASSYLGGEQIKDSAKDATKASNYQNNLTRMDMQPWLTSGKNALNSYNSALGLGSYSSPMGFDAWTKANPGIDKNRKEKHAFYAANFTPEWTGGTGQPDSQIYDPFSAPPGSELPQWGGSNPFQFNLEDDPIYQFQRDEALQATERKLNAMDMGKSGNILTALNDRAANVAGTYQDAAFGRQLAGSQENQNRMLTDYGLGTDYANTQYGRGVGEYGMDVNRSNDIYGRDQNYLNRLAQLSGSGQNAAAQLGGFGANSAAQIGQYGMAGGQASANQWQGANNALQGSIGNYLTHDLYSNNPYLMGNNTNYLDPNLGLGGAQTPGFNLGGYGS